MTTPPADTVVAFLRHLEAKRVSEAMDLLADDAVWINVSLPTVRGRDRIESLIRRLDGRGHFRVHFHTVAEQGGVVLTERTDALGTGRFEQRFWVYGRFEFRDGKIIVWRDSFDWLDVGVSLLRAAAGMAVPGLNRAWPGD